MYLNCVLLAGRFVEGQATDAVAARAELVEEFVFVEKVADASPDRLERGLAFLYRLVQ